MNKICPICGSNNLKSLDSITHQYKCLSCDSVFTLSKEFKSILSENKVLSANEIFTKNIDSIVEISCMFGDDMSSGTGFYISKDGYILTNTHVLVDINNNKPQLCDHVYLSKSKSNDYKELEIIYMDAKNDIALLKSNTFNAKPVIFSKDKLSIGDKIYAIGNSKGYGLMLLDGIVCDLERDFKGHKTFLFNALVTNGCSGGPIFNTNGELCGMIEGGSNEAAGMNYGIYNDTLNDLIKKTM